MHFNHRTPKRQVGSVMTASSWKTWLNVKVYVKSIELQNSIHYEAFQWWCLRRHSLLENEGMIKSCIFFAAWSLFPTLDWNIFGKYRSFCVMFSKYKGRFRRMLWCCVLAGNSIKIPTEQREWSWHLQIRKVTAFPICRQSQSGNI